MILALALQAALCGTSYQLDGIPVVGALNLHLWSIRLYPNQKTYKLDDITFGTPKGQLFTVVETHDIDLRHGDYRGKAHHLLFEFSDKRARYQCDIYGTMLAGGSFKIDDLGCVNLKTGKVDYRLAKMKQATIKLYSPEHEKYVGVNLLTMGRLNPYRPD